MAQLNNLVLDGLELVLEGLAVIACQRPPARFMDGETGPKLHREGEQCHREPEDTQSAVVEVPRWRWCCSR